MKAIIKYKCLIMKYREAHNTNYEGTIRYKLKQEIFFFKLGELKEHCIITFQS